MKVNKKSYLMRFWRIYFVIIPLNAQLRLYGAMGRNRARFRQNKEKISLMIL